MSHHHAKFKKNPYFGFQEQSKQVFWAPISVKFGARESFLKIGLRHFFSSMKWLNAKYAKFQQNTYGASFEELFTDLI